MIERWESRLAAMDHSRGTTDKMRKAAMLAEIKALRLSVSQADRKLAEVRAQRDEWKAHTRRYQKELARIKSQ